MRGFKPESASPSPPGVPAESPHASPREAGGSRLDPAFEGTPGVPEPEEFGVQDLRQDLEGLSDAWAGTVEIGVAIRQIDAPRAHGPQLPPAGTRNQGLHLAPRADQIEAAGERDDHLWIRPPQLLPI